MNPEQLKLFISGAFGNESDAKAIRRMLSPYLRSTLDIIIERVEQLPDGSLDRRQMWRLLLRDIEELLGPYNDAFKATLDQELPRSGEKAQRETIEQLKSVRQPVPAGQLRPELVMPGSVRQYLENTKIAGKTLQDLFDREQKRSPFIKHVADRINQIVTGGMIKGDSTAAIAKELGNTLGIQLQRETMTLARTAIQDYNRQVQEDVWDANEEALEGLHYEFVAALDSKTCFKCARYDGVVTPNKSELPQKPVHPNCRCDIVRVDPDDPGRIRYSQVISEDKMTGPGAYKSKVKVKGEKFYRKNEKVKVRSDGKSPTYPDWLADLSRRSGEKAADTTLAEFFGSEKRARSFKRHLARGLEPQAALARTIDGVSD